MSLTTHQHLKICKVLDAVKRQFDQLDLKIVTDMESLLLHSANGMDQDIMQYTYIINMHKG